MNTLIVKLDATGDVVRTTPLLHCLRGSVTWVTSPKNTILLSGLTESLRCLSWEERTAVLGMEYDLVINLEDSLDVAQLLKTVCCAEKFGAYMAGDGNVAYTGNSKRWFDLSLISSYGKLKADKLKFQNRQTYQEMIFAGLGLHFAGEPYCLPNPIETGLSGDVAMAAEAGPVWPMKKWAYYKQLKERLETEGLIVNVLTRRTSLLEHLSDVRNHRCLVSGDTLPMHFALGTGVPCVSLFTCTSPWEIYGYGLLKTIVSPRLGEFFYKRSYDERATTAISVDEVFDAVMAQLEASASLAKHAAVK